MKWHDLSACYLGGFVAYVGSNIELTWLCGYLCGYLFPVSLHVYICDAAVVLLCAFGDADDANTNQYDHIYNV
jgi:hypothetical protein